MARHRQSEINDAHWLEDLETTVFNLGGGSPLAKRSAISVTPLQTFFGPSGSWIPLRPMLILWAGRAVCVRPSSNCGHRLHAILHLMRNRGHRPTTAVCCTSRPDRVHTSSTSSRQSLPPPMKPSSLSSEIRPCCLRGASPRVCRVLAQTAGRLLGCMSTTEPPSMRSP